MGVVVAAYAEVPGKPRGVRVIKCLTTSVQLNVEPPEYSGGPRVTGFIIHNELQVTRVNLGTVHTKFGDDQEQSPVSADSFVLSDLLGLVAAQAILPTFYL